MTKSIANEFLNIDEASKFLKIAKTTLYTWVHFRKIPFRKHGKRLVFNVQELLNWSAKK